MHDIFPRHFDSVEALIYKADGHYHLQVPTLYEYDSYANMVIDFIFDTGAYLAVISPATATLLGFTDRFTIQAGIKLAGFSGECVADLKEIPGFIIGGKRLEGVKVAVPHVEIDMDILGLNVIEHFKYFIDTECDKIHFAENPKPDIPSQLLANNICAVAKNKSE